MKNNREQDTRNHKHGGICSEVRVTALRPRLHYYGGFHYPLRRQRQMCIRDSFKGSSINGPYTKELQLGLHKIRVHNSTTQPST